MSPVMEASRVRSEKMSNYRCVSVKFKVNLNQTLDKPVNESVNQVCCRQPGDNTPNRTT